MNKYTATLAIDNVISAQTLSLRGELTIRELIEEVFVQLQTDAVPDPFKLTVEYYGYDHFQGNKSYLGYFIVSVDKYISDMTHYWDVLVNDKPASLGIDSYLVQPGDRVELKFVAVSAAAPAAAERLKRIHARRAQVAKKA